MEGTRHSSLMFGHMQKGILHEFTGPKRFIDLGILKEAMVASVLNTHRVRNHRREVLNEIEEDIKNSVGWICPGEDKILL
ncbi:unnamed protein product [Arabis nemorensis]|uniref:Uncharacterized protein n=1 Tax=Arabis nemorensis TaxID=586526 RepID=A0A565BDP9_9BRAS|nr:unnamed protein product [Arabis nemorensis]